MRLPKRAPINMDFDALSSTACTPCPAARAQGASIAPCFAMCKQFELTVFDEIVAFQKSDDLK